MEGGRDPLNSRLLHSAEWKKGPTPNKPSKSAFRNDRNGTRVDINQLGLKDFLRRRAANEWLRGNSANSAVRRLGPVGFPAGVQLIVFSAKPGP